MVAMIRWYDPGCTGDHAKFAVADAGWLVPLPCELGAMVRLSVQTAHQAPGPQGVAGTHSCATIRQLALRPRGDPHAYFVESQPLPDVPAGVLTNRLCAAVEMNPVLAAWVVVERDEQSIKALCPYFGADQDSVAGHADSSYVRWGELDDRLRPVAPLVDLFALAALASVALLVAQPASAIAFGALLTASLTGLTGAYLYGFRLCQRVIEQSVAAARKVLSRPDGGRQDSSKTNVIVYPAWRVDPFVGSGQQVSRLVLHPIDAGKGARAPDGTEAKPSTFTVRELHDYFIAAAAQWPVDGGVAAHNRLYVRGDVVGEIPELLPDPIERPVGSVSAGLLHQGIDRPTERARTYLCIEKEFEGGEIVATQFVRFVFEGRMLSLEIVSYLLTAVTAGVVVPAYCQGIFDSRLIPMPKRTPQRAVRAAAWRLMNGRLAGHRWNSDKVFKDHFEWIGKVHELLEYGVPPEYGADNGLRQSLTDGVVHARTAGTPMAPSRALSASYSYFNGVDVDEVLQRLQRCILATLEAFLETKDIDTFELSQRQETIVNSTIYSIGAVTGSGHHIGAGGQISNLANPQQQPASPAPAGRKGA